MLKPRLSGKPALDKGKLVIDDAHLQYQIASNGGDAQQLLSALKLMDGRHTHAQIAHKTGMPRSEVQSLVTSLEQNDLACTEKPTRTRPALEVLFELEDLANELLHESIYRNVFWHNLLYNPEQAPEHVFYGMAIENYHFLFRESYFDAPALNFSANTRVRLLMNEFYTEELGHDELILKGLQAVGITRDDLADTIPLPETMALCNALSFWARYDPVFFFSTLGILEGKDLRVDSYLEACERKGLTKDFIKPIRAHAELNIKGEHGSLTRAMFSHLPPISEQTALRMKAQTRLFVRTYDCLYSGIWNHYSRARRLLRRVSEVHDA
jgi:hypothetical protein